MSVYANDPRVTWDEGAARFVDPSNGHTVRVSAYDEVFQVVAVVSRGELTWSPVGVDATIAAFLGDPQ